EHGQDARECRIVLESKQDGGAMDLEVTATAFDADGESYTICFIKDISRTKRLEVLTRMFFHDVLNTSGGIQGFAEMVAVKSSLEGDKDEDLARLATLASQLVEEIQAQRDLTYAESGELVTHFEPVETATFLEDLRTLYTTHKVAADRDIELCDVWGGSIVTDRRLLARVLGNMLKNALEATEPGGVVEVRCTDDEDQVTFSVWNASVMPNRVQLQVFQRSFSTKAKAGRGIGTHSMKLLGESHLGGHVSFSSKAPEGTVFTVELPKKPTTASTEQRDVAETLPTQTLRGRVLLAEDGPDNQRLISFILKKAGLDVDLAENGRIACERALASESEGRPYDLILMDVQMPELDGHGATQQLRKHGWQGPIVALTALVTKADHKKCLEAGCTDCATKPIDRATLLATVARHLQPTRGQFAPAGAFGEGG
ncbi:MAG: response regulator, partial [Chloroflexota bacterium]|nr:response regulator [Chloroflexota bacterium]